MDDDDALHPQYVEWLAQEEAAGGRATVEGEGAGADAEAGDSGGGAGAGADAGAGAGLVAAAAEPLAPGDAAAGAAAGLRPPAVVLFRMLMPHGQVPCVCGGAVTGARVDAARTGTL